MSGQFHIRNHLFRIWRNLARWRTVLARDKLERNRAFELFDHTRITPGGPVLVGSSHNRSVLHDKVNFSQGLYIVQRILRHRNDIGIKVGRHGAPLRLDF
jgi:hypothetical protein